MDTGTDKNNLDWLSPDVLIEFIDELREAGYKIGISQYIAAQDLILMLIARGETLDSPERLRNLLGPIFCSSPIEQEEFQQRFNHWVELFNRPNLSIVEVDVEAKALSAELGTEHALFSRMQRLIFLILIFIFLPIILFLFCTQFRTHKNPSILTPTPIPIPIPTSTPTPTLTLIPTTPLPTVPQRQLKPEPSKNSPFNWQILVLLLTVYVVIFLIWRLWWLWRANLFLQRHSTTQQPELQKISITGFEENLVPSIVLLQIARSLRYRIRVPSHELDVDKTIDVTLKQGGWLTPVYRNYQVLPEYLFLVNRASYRDHQAKFVEEIIERLKNEGVFVTIYFFDDDPRMCFPHEHGASPLRLREITSKYSQHSLVIISNTENFFNSISGKLEPWVNQLIKWESRVFLTPSRAENWGYQELELAQQFIILPATVKGLLVLSQRLRQGFATYFLSEEPRIPLPDSLRIQPYLWIERNPPPIEQINIMLDSLEKYLGKHSFYWLSACAVFPESDWNITIYLGNVLKTESGASLIEVCSLTDLASLPWLRYGYMPDWLRVYLITTLTQEQQQIIRSVLQDLLIMAVQGSVSKLQLEIARQYANLLPKLANPILDILSKKATVDSPLKDYIFLGFMKEQSILSMRVSDEFSRVLQRQKRNYWWMKLLRKLGIMIKPPIHQPSFAESAQSTSSLISSRQFLKWLGLGGAGLLISLLMHHHITQKFRTTYLPTSPEFKFVLEPGREGGGNFHNGLARVRINGMSGYIDREGKIQISPNFDSVLDFSKPDNLALAWKNGQNRGYINNQGNYQIQPKYSYKKAGQFSEGKAYICFTYTCGYIDTTDKEVIKQKFTGAGRFSETLAPVKTDGKWGYINQAGTFSIPPSFEEAYQFREGLAPVTKDNKWIYINKDGKSVIIGNFEKISYFSEGLAAVKQGNKWGYINSKDEMVIRPQFDEPKDYPKRYDCDATDISGNKAECKYLDNRHDFSEGLAAIYMNGKWGYIDRQGNLVIPPQFSEANNFSERLAYVCQGEDKDKKCGYISNPIKTLIIKTSNGFVNLRDTPSVKGTLLEKILDGSSITILSEKTNSDKEIWYQVKVNNKVGWIRLD